ncbi:MAG: 4-hydroxy-3-methylbut-2-enyl diphosphate reductase [Candidatus Neomarinimicrobiota bacterium]
MALKVTVSAGVGFCAGVQAAVNKARESARKYGRVAMLGDIVHNEKVVCELSAIGVHVISNLDEVDQAMPLLFRSHGTPLNVWEEARQRGLTIIDATCPLVRQIHTEAKMLADEGRQLIIIGDKNHEEVEGIASQVNGAIVVSGPGDAQQLPILKKIGVVAQSTQLIENVTAVIAILSAKTEDLRFINTICRPTRQRQEQIRELARNNDVMIVVGSRKSANTKRLVQIAEVLNKNTYLVDSASEIQSVWFEGKTTVGVSAGASTPIEVVEAVVKKIGNIA